MKLTATDMQGIVGASGKSVKRKIKLSKNLSDFVRPEPRFACGQIAAVSGRDTPPLTSCLRFGECGDWSDCARDVEEIGKSIHEVLGKTTDCSVDAEEAVFAGESPWANPQASTLAIVITAF